MSKFFESLPDGKGGFTTIEWSLKDYLTVKAMGILVVMAATVITTSIIPAVWLLLYFISDEKERKVENIVAILAGIYYLMDYHNGWITFLFLRIILSDGAINAFTYFNTALIITHAILLFFGRRIYFTDNTLNDDERMGRFVGAVVVFLVIGYMVAHALIPHILPPVIIPR